MSKDKQVRRIVKPLSLATVRGFKLRYSKAVANEAFASAVKRAFTSKCPVYVYPTHTGWVATVKKPSLPFAHPYRMIQWDADASEAICEEFVTG